MAFIRAEWFRWNPALWLRATCNVRPFWMPSPTIHVGAIPVRGPRRRHQSQAATT